MYRCMCTLNFLPLLLPVQTPRLYCLGDVGDLTEVVDHIHTTLPSSPLIGVGTSMGRCVHIRAF